MKYFWSVNYLCNFMYFLVSAVVYYSFGRWCAGLTLFSETNIFLLGSLFLGWGLCQISLAFTYSAFFEKQQSAQVMGYMLSVVGCCLFTGISMTEGHLDSTRRMYWWLRLHPLPNYCRIIYLLTEQCAWHECVSKLDAVNPEIVTCLTCLYLNAVAYLVLAIYLEEVMPTANGIPRHPLYFLERTLTTYLPKVASLIYLQEAKLAELISDELVGEDEDVS